MSKSKTSVLSFRLTSELLDEARKRAEAGGEKNASAWCKKLIVKELARNESVEENSNYSTGSDNQAIQLAAINNLRSLMLKSFEMIFSGTQKEEAFRSNTLVIEEDSKKINNTDFNSMVDELSDELENLLDGEKLIVRADANNINFSNETEINHFENSPVQ